MKKTNLLLTLGLFSSLIFTPLRSANAATASLSIDGIFSTIPLVIHFKNECTMTSANSTWYSIANTAKDDHNHLYTWSPISVTIGGPGTVAYYYYIQFPSHAATYGFWAEDSGTAFTPPNIWYNWSAITNTVFITQN